MVAPLRLLLFSTLDMFFFIVEFSHCSVLFLNLLLDISLVPMPRFMQLAEEEIFSEHRICLDWLCVWEV